LDHLDEVADLLIQQKVVGLYTGRNEFGARALGARSILADPRNAAMWEIVNSKVKHREKWRPFAPVIIEGYEKDYFIDGRPSYYMMEAFRILPERREQIPAVVHVDGTCRPQSISQELNPVYFNILDSFFKKTGVPVLMNTSFNVKDEPIVARPVEALRCYLSTGLDALLIGPFLLVKT
jgi:carbamoyltransferase